MPTIAPVLPLSRITATGTENARIVEELEEKKHGLKVLLEHQEKEPEPIRKRTLPDDGSYGKLGVLKIDIENITGKQGL